MSDFKNLDIEYCECNDMFQVLVYNGLFPTSPSKPRMAVSINLLDFYHALFERSCNTVNAMASALNSYYIHRGFVVLNSQVSEIHFNTLPCLIPIFCKFRVFHHQTPSAEALVLRYSGMKVFDYALKM